MKKSNKLSLPYTLKLFLILIGIIIYVSTFIIFNSLGNKSVLWHDRQNTCIHKQQLILEKYDIYPVVNNYD